MNATAVHIKDSNGLLSLWLSVGIFFFVNFDAVGGNFLLAITSHVPSETQRHAPNKKYYYLFCLEPFCEETFLHLFAKEILPYSIILKFFAGFQVLNTNNRDISKHFHLEKWWHVIL